MMIELSHLEKHYSTPSGVVPALKDVNLSVATGEIFGVIGRSGAGKSTLIRCVNLLERPSSGTVSVAGIHLTQLPAAQLRTARHQIGMIFQHFNLLSSCTVFQNIALPLQLLGHSKLEINKAVDALLELVDLTDKKNIYPTQLSGGQKQRVAIARALAAKPKVLLSDEATSALDPHSTQSILTLLRSINEQLGLTILLITHEMEVIKQICDRVALIHHGSIIEQAETIQFLTAPQTPLAQTFARSCLKQDLPPNLDLHLEKQPSPNSNPVLRILFRGEVTTEPLISQLIQTFGIELNILQANIENIRNLTIGTMVFKVGRQQDKLQAMIKYLQQKGLTVEVIGYVSSHA